MRRVVVTGMGIVSSIGNNTQEVLASLHDAKSGIKRAEKYAELGFRSQVQGAPTLNPADVVDRRAMRFLGEGAAWNHVAMEQAIQDSGLSPEEVSDVRTGIIMGSGGPSTRTVVEAADVTRSKGPKRVGPFAVPKAMSSTASATLATWFKIKGVNYSIASACATSNHCIGNAAEMIQWGKQDMMFAGGCEELDWTLSVLFDAMGAMSSSYNQMPDKASRAYDKDRDGFVIAGGAGVQETIYSLLMMQNGFICQSANIETLDPAFEDIPIVRERRDDVQLNCVLSNSFGFGGTNASVVFKRLDA